MPILLDYSAISVAAIFSQKTNKIDEGMMRHQILNSIRMHNVKYRDKFGELVIACDGGSWRKNVFPEYKAARAKGREESGIDWEAAWAAINKVKSELIEHMPYRVVQVKGCEADDIIATLVENTQEFGNLEPVMIVSADHDFLQLQKYSNVQQFSTVTKKLSTEKNPKKYLIEQVLRGCKGDGVPNVLSPDDSFVTGTRQKSVSAKMIETWTSNYSDLSKVMDEATYKNFQRNRECIDFAYIPEELSKQIMEEFEKQPITPNSKVFPYLVSNRCNLLIGCAAEFFPRK